MFLLITIYTLFVGNFAHVLLLLKTAKKFNSTLSTFVPEENKIDDREC